MRLRRILAILFIAKFVCSIMGDIYSLQLHSKFHKVEAGTFLFGYRSIFSISFRERERERREEREMDSVWQLHGIHSNV